MLCNKKYKKNFPNYKHEPAFRFKGIAIGKISRKKFYNIISPISEANTPLCISSWKRKYNVNINKDHWKLTHSLQEGKLVTLCWKIIHRIYPTNTILFNMKLKQTQKCTHCDLGEPDFLDHFFFNCTRIKEVWREVQWEIFNFMKLRIILTDKVILLGLLLIPGINRAQQLHINKVIAIGKLAISKYKFEQARPVLDIYRSEAEIRNIWVKYC